MSKDSDGIDFVTDNNTGGHFVCECQNCGEVFNSQDMDGGEPNADAGDFGDCYCPKCGQVDPEECANANLVWNVQQKKINAINVERDEQNIVLSAYKSAVTSMTEMITNHEYVGHPMPWSKENEDLDNLHCKIIDLHNDISRIGGERDQLVKALESFLDLVGDSHGVAGYHLNGDIAEWNEFECVGEAYELINRIEGGAA